jgi:outer membrane lipoprotein carrier protein
MFSRQYLLTNEHHSFCVVNFGTLFEISLKTQNLHSMKTHSLISGFAFAALIALPVASFAQVKTGPDYDPKAKTILDGVSATAKAYSSITATFTISTEKPGGVKETKTGSVILKGNMYKISLDNKNAKGVAYKEEYYNDGTTMWVYNENDKECTEDYAPDPAKKKNDNVISPTEIFTFHEKGFKYKFIKEETQTGGKVVQLIDLYPEVPDKKTYHTVKLTIDKVKKQIISIVLMNKDGSKTTYTVNTFTPNTVYTDATFKFDKTKHPGVSIINMKEEEDDK